MDPQVSEAEIVHEPIAERSGSLLGNIKTMLAVGGLVLLVGGVAGGVYLSQQQQNIQQHAAAASNVIGYLDNRTNTSKWCSAITGWTCDKANPSEPIGVHLYAPDPYKAGVTHPLQVSLANNSSTDESDIAKLCGGVTASAHRFSLQIPDSLKNNKPFTIYVYGIGLDGKTNPLLIGSGLSVTCAPPVKPSISPSVSPSVSPTATQLLGDINHDGVVNILDYSILMGCFGDKAGGATCSDPSIADLNNDGVVDGIDYNILLRALLGSQ